MKNLIFTVFFVLSAPLSSFALTCGIYKAGNIPSSHLFKKALAACDLGEVVLNQSKYGKITDQVLITVI